MEPVPVTGYEYTPHEFSASAVDTTEPSALSSEAPEKSENQSEFAKILAGLLGESEKQAETEALTADFSLETGINIVNNGDRAENEARKAALGFFSEGDSEKLTAISWENTEENDFPEAKISDEAAGLLGMELLLGRLTDQNTPENEIPETGAEKASGRETPHQFAVLENAESSKNADYLAQAIKPGAESAHLSDTNKNSAR
jgi:hypothetical protein